MAQALSQGSGGWQRRQRWVWSLVALVGLGHLSLLWALQHMLPPSRLGEGDADGPPKALDVAFVKELAPAAPPVVVRSSPSLPPTSAGVSPPPAAKPASAASAPQAEAPLPEAVAVLTSASAPVAVTEEPSVPTLAAASTQTPPEPTLASAAPSPSAVPPTEAAFEWPASTRLSYVLKGDFRGPIEGQATVEWLRQGQHYQVRVKVGAALFFTREMVSSGMLGPAGLQPQRYDEVTDTTFGKRRQQRVQFEPDGVALATGQKVAAPPDVQDTASQLVQLTWRFTQQPGLLQPGNTVLVPLALPRRVGLWTYDVGLREVLPMPFGPLEAIALQPRPDSSRPDEITMSLWVAPSLQYLPVRLRFEQRSQGFFAELNLASRPLQAADARP